MSDIGARFVACKGWRWIQGMRAIGVNHNNRKCSGVVTEIVNGRPNVVTIAGDDVLLISAEPDTSAPSTLGCILALVREAWGNPTIHTQASGPFWIVVAGAGWSGDDLTGEQDGEAAALLAALEAAP